MFGTSPALTVSVADITLMNGLLDGLGFSDPGVLLLPGGHNFILNAVEITDWADGLRIAGGSPFTLTSFKVVNSYIHDNANAGLQVGPNATFDGVVTIEGNLFKANGAFGVENLSGVDLNATFNSWGCFDGPGNSGCDGAGANVLYNPFTFSEMYLDMEPPLNATSVSILETQDFDVEMKIDALNVSGLTFDFTYDAGMMTLNSVTFGAPWDSSCFPVGAPVTGQLTYRCNLAPPPTPSGYTMAESLIASLNFTAENNGSLIDPGPWMTNFDLDEQTTTAGAVGGVRVFVNNAGYGASERPPIDDSDDGEVVIGPVGNFGGFIDLQGRSNDSGGTLTVYDDDDVGTATALAAGTSNSAGSYATSGIAGALLPLGDTYWLYVDAPLYLPTTADPDLLYAHSAVLTDRPVTPLNLVLLRGGDATDNNFVNVLDATCIGTDFGGTISTCVTGHSDVNADGSINILDLTLMGSNWQHGFSEWTP